MALKNANGDWLNARGKSVPISYVNPMDRKKDATVESIIKAALKMEAKQRELKAKWLKKIAEFYAALQAEAGVAVEGKGNICLTNFSGDKQVEFSMHDIIAFDEKLGIAKQLIDGCLSKWSVDAHPNLKVVIDQAFEVDKKGNVNTSAILKLRELNIKDGDWQTAMEMIADSISVSGTRQYLNVRIRKNPTDKFRTINLNMSSM